MRVPASRAAAMIVVRSMRVVSGAGTAPKLEVPGPPGAPRDDNFRSLPDTRHDPPSRSDRPPVRDRPARAPAGHRRAGGGVPTGQLPPVPPGPAPPLPPAVRRAGEPGLDLRGPGPRQPRAPAHGAD